MRMRWSVRLAIALGMLAGGVLSITWSWTFTRLGRLDYGAAIAANLSRWVPASETFDAESRARAESIARAALPSYPQTRPVRFEDRRIESADGAEIPIRIYWPERAGDDPASAWPFYLDLHGGGWRLGGDHLFHEQVLALAGRIPAIVVSVDYRLAPEYPFPTPLEDCRTALHWIVEHGESIGGDPTRIAIGGSSAGANLAAALALRARDEGGPEIAFEYLEMPATDLSGTRQWRSYDETGDRYGLKVSSLETMFEDYVPDPRARIHPYVSPLLEGDLSGLPPTLVVTALFDPLRDQGEAYARRLEDAGVRVELHREEGALHGFVGSPARARRIQAMAAAAIREALYARPTVPVAGRPSAS